VQLTRQSTEDASSSQGFNVPAGEAYTAAVADGDSAVEGSLQQEQEMAAIADATTSSPRDEFSSVVTRSQQTVPDTSSVTAIPVSSSVAPAADTMPTGSVVALASPPLTSPSTRLPFNIALIPPDACPLSQASSAAAASSRDAEERKPMELLTVDEVDNLFKNLGTPPALSRVVRATQVNGKELNSSVKCGVSVLFRAYVRDSEEETRLLLILRGFQRAGGVPVHMLVDGSSLDGTQSLVRWNAFNLRTQPDNNPVPSFLI
jgi:hypothetical protein